MGANTPAQAAPSSARSFYVYQYALVGRTTEVADAGSGDASEAGAQKHYVVLDFGAMYQNSGGTWMVSAFGGTDFSMSKAREMAEHWAEGYWTCTGGDHTSVAYVGIGTNNSGGDITSAAGAHLASVVTNGNDDLHGTPNYYDQGRIMGADDFEKLRVWVLAQHLLTQLDGRIQRACRHPHRQLRLRGRLSQWKHTVCGRLQHGAKCRVDLARLMERTRLPPARDLSE